MPLSVVFKIFNNCSSKEWFRGSGRRILCASSFIFASSGFLASNMTSLISFARRSWTLLSVTSFVVSHSSTVVRTSQSL